MSERQGIEIDYCPKCRGVWLDRGELDKFIQQSLALRGVNTFHGSASFVDPHTIRVVSGDGVETLVHGEKISIATGSSPLRPAEFHFEDDLIHDSNEILELKALPKKLVVIGAGVIGCEYAGTFAARP